jgi:hypothetical protein
MSKQNEKETHSARRDEEILIARQTLRGGTECYLLLSREETRIDFLYILTDSSKMATGKVLR